jgi:hypothetical protein
VETPAFFLYLYTLKTHSMKKLFTLAALSFSTVIVSQSLAVYKTTNAGVNTETITNGYNLQESTSPGAETVTKIKIKNTSASTQTYNVVRSIVFQSPNLILNGSTTTPRTYFCFGNSCFTSDISSPGMADYTILLAAGQTSTNFPSADNSKDNNQPFIIYADEASSMGKYTVRYKVFNVNTSTDTLSFNIQYNKELGIRDLDAGNGMSLELYPNPSKGNTSLKVNAIAAGSAEVIILNQLGQVTKSSRVQIQPGLNEVNLNSSELAPGIYEVIVKTEKSSLSKKLVIVK